MAPVRYWFNVLVLSGILVSCANAVFALPVSPAAVAQITTNIDESNRVRLAGNTHPKVLSGRAMEMGAVESDFALPHMFLQLKRSPERQQAVEQFMEELQTQGSAHYHQWLTAEQFGDLYGPAPQDIARVTAWLKSHGFAVNTVYPSGMVIDFSGNAQQVQEAFGTQIHRYNVNGKVHIANASDPTLPAALAGVVVGVVSLNDFFPRPLFHKHIPSIVSQGSDNPNPDFTYQNSIYKHYNVSPVDFNTIYDVTPLWNNGITGAGQTIAVLEDGTNMNPNDWTTFRHAFSLDGYAGTFQQIHPGPISGGTNCVDPWAASGEMAPADGSDADAETEASLDAEWAGVAAPDANIELVSCNDSPMTAGIQIAATNLIEEGYRPSIISVSYGACELSLGTTGNAYFNNTWMQAASEGISVFVSTGDSAAAGCDANGAPYAEAGANISGYASTPYNVAVGGTDFDDTATGTLASYWNAGLTSVIANQPVTDTKGQAISYIPEIPWNDSCASSIVLDFINANGGSNYPMSPPGTSYPDALSLCNSPTALSLLTSSGTSPIGPTEDPLEGLVTTSGGSGGKSSCATMDTMGNCFGYPKPNWQAGGIPESSTYPGVYGDLRAAFDGVRDIPDVSLLAAPGLWSHAYLICMSDPHPADSSQGGSHTSAWNAPCTYVNNPNTSSPMADNVSYNSVGGTSASSPSFAGIQALIDQTSGPQGNVNPVLYQLAAQEYGAPGLNPNNGTPSTTSPSTITCNTQYSGNREYSAGCIFHDIAVGSIDVPCWVNDTSGGGAAETTDCYTPASVDPSGTNCTSGPCGILASNVDPSSYGALLSAGQTEPVPEYAAQAGWDYATGLGSVDAVNLVHAVMGVEPADSSAALAFGVQPQTVINLHPTPMLGNVTVQVQDASGRLVTSATSMVTISLGSNPSGATLIGTLTQPAINGIARFTDLAVAVASDPYTLVASSSGISSATSNDFEVIDPVTSLVFIAPSVSVEADSVLHSITVQMRDSANDPLVPGVLTLVSAVIVEPSCDITLEYFMNTYGTVTFPTPPHFYAVHTGNITASLVDDEAVPAVMTTFAVTPNSDLIFGDSLESCR